MHQFFIHIFILTCSWWSNIWVEISCLIQLSIIVKLIFVLGVAILIFVIILISGTSWWPLTEGRGYTSKVLLLLLLLLIFGQMERNLIIHARISTNHYLTIIACSRCHHIRLKLEGAIGIISVLLQDEIASRLSWQLTPTVFFALSLALGLFDPLFRLWSESVIELRLHNTCQFVIIDVHRRTHASKGRVWLNGYSPFFIFLITRVGDDDIDSFS